MYAIAINQLEKTYNNGFTALKGIDLTVEQGDFFGLLGPNGAGKTTVIGILSSLVNKSSGQVKICGVDIDQDFSTAKSHLGVVPQEFNFSIFETVEDIIFEAAGYYGLTRRQAKPRIESLLKRLNLWDKRRQVSRNLSGGMKRRLMIVRALVHQPAVLILDEPTAGVDIELRRSMWDFLRDLNAAGTTVILTTHYLEEAESLCKHIAIINHGEIIENTTTKQLLSQMTVETFIVDVKQTLASLPSMSNVTLRQIDDQSLELEVPKGLSVSEVVQAFAAENIIIDRIRNKANRLEELFLSLVDNDKAK